LLDLGGTLFHKVGLGDFQHDFEYEGEFDPW
jgi:sulfite reductase alpha subunit-like flavoprotein